jgi:hypothetical protein
MPIDIAVKTRVRLAFRYGEISIIKTRIRSTMLIDKRNFNARNNMGKIIIVAKIMILKLKLRIIRHVTSFISVVIKKDGSRLIVN